MMMTQIYIGVKPSLRLMPPEWGRANQSTPPKASLSSSIFPSFASGCLRLRLRLRGGEGPRE